MIHINKLNFSTLGITIESELYSLRDDGFIEDMGAHIEKVFQDGFGNLIGYKEFTKHIPRIDKDTPPAVYMCIHRKGEMERKYVIFYKHTDALSEIYRRSHEETHVLHHIGQIALLQEKLNEVSVQIDLMKYPDYDKCSVYERELVANIGSLYALQKNGSDVATILPEDNCVYFRPAIRIYQGTLKNKTSVIKKITKFIPFNF